MQPLKKVSLTTLLSLLPALAPVGCGEVPTEDEDEETETSDLLNGTTASSSGNLTIRFNGPDAPNTGTLTCSGTLITNSWVLTANHCVRSKSTSGMKVTLVQSNGTSTTIDVDRIALHPSNANFVPLDKMAELQGNDVILLHLKSPFTINGSSTGFSRPLWPFSATALPGNKLNCFGYSTGTLTTGVLPATKAELNFTSVVNGVTLQKGDLVTYGMNSQGQRLDQGDSGGPCFFTMSGTTYQASVTSGGGMGLATSTPFTRDWVDQTLYSAPKNLNWSAKTKSGTGVAVSSRKAKALDLFWVDQSSGNVKTRSSDNDAWQAEDKVKDSGRPQNAPILGKPASISRSASVVDVFVTGGSSGKQLFFRRKTNGAWDSGWVAMGNRVAATSAPAVASWGSGRMDLFVRGPSNELRHNFFDSNQWFMIEDNLGGVLANEPAAVSWGFGRIDVFVRGTDKAIHHKWFDDQWMGGDKLEYDYLGGDMSGPPTVASWKSGRLDVFARGNDRTLKHKWFEGNWSDGWITNNRITPACHPSARSWGAGRVDLFSSCGGSQSTATLQVHQSTFPRR